MNLPAPSPVDRSSRLRYTVQFERGLTPFDPDGALRPDAAGHVARRRGDLDGAQEMQAAVEFRHRATEE